MPEVLLHKQFIDSWQNLSYPESQSVIRLIELLRQGQLTPGMRPHIVGSFLSLSPNMDLRILAVSQHNRYVLVHINHHDAAYQWASRTSILSADFDSIELVDISQLSLATGIKHDQHGYTLPLPIQDILRIDNVDVFLQIISNMSPEWQEWLLNTFSEPNFHAPVPLKSSLVFSPTNDDDLAMALQLEIPAWRMFLHPIQKSAVEDIDSSSIAILGGPGTGKTIVLLNRLASNSPKGKETDCSVLLTYSQSLAEHMHALIKRVSKRHFYVLPLFFLGGKLPSNVMNFSTYRKIRLVVDDGALLIQYQNGDRRTVRELLVDEVQDIPRYTSKTISHLLAASKTRITLAADIDQAIQRANQDDISQLLDNCVQQYELTYSYRSTRQILEVARQWLSVYGVQPVSACSFGLVGPKVNFLMERDLNHQVKTCLEVMRNLLDRYSPQDVALIYGQYFNPRFKGTSDEERELKKYPELGNQFKFADTTKGKEYFAGIIFVSKTFLAKEMTEEEKRLRINVLYVALTRFRDEVYVVYTPECTIKKTSDRLAGTPSLLL